jgi:hypothetical protein
MTMNRDDDRFARLGQNYHGDDRQKKRALWEFANGREPNDAELMATTNVMARAMRKRAIQDFLTYYCGLINGKTSITEDCPYGIIGLLVDVSSFTHTQNWDFRPIENRWQIKTTCTTAFSRLLASHANIWETVDQMLIKATPEKCELEIEIDGLFSPKLREFVRLLIQLIQISGIRE